MYMGQSKGRTPRSLYTFSPNVRPDWEAVLTILPSHNRAKTALNPKTVPAVHILRGSSVPHDPAKRTVSADPRTPSPDIPLNLPIQPDTGPIGGPSAWVGGSLSTGPARRPAKSGPRAHRAPTPTAYPGERDLGILCNGCSQGLTQLHFKCKSCTKFVLVRYPTRLSLLGRLPLPLS